MSVYHHDGCPEEPKEKEEDSAAQGEWFTKANIQREHAPLLGRSVLSEGVGSFIYNPDEEDDDEDDDDDDEYDEGESAWRGQVDDTSTSDFHGDVSGMLTLLRRQHLREPEEGAPDTPLPAAVHRNDTSRPQLLRVCIPRLLRRLARLPCADIAL